MSVFEIPFKSFYVDNKKVFKQNEKRPFYIFFIGHFTTCPSGHNGPKGVKKCPEGQKKSKLFNHSQIFTQTL